MIAGIAGMAGGTDKCRVRGIYGRGGARGRLSVKITP